MIDRNSDWNINIYAIKYTIIYKYYCTYALSVEQYSIINILWFNIFRVPASSSMCTKTDRFTYLYYYYYYYCYYYHHYYWFCFRCYYYHHSLMSTTLVKTSDKCWSLLLLHCINAIRKIAFNLIIYNIYTYNIYNIYNI